jgi:hypothetical protein
VRRLQRSSTVSVRASALSRCVVFDSESKHVARKMEGTDLAVAVAEKLVSAHRAADLVDELGFLRLPIDFLVAAIAHLGSDELRPVSEQMGVTRGGSTRNGASPLLDGR